MSSKTKSGVDPLYAKLGLMVGARWRPAPDPDARWCVASDIPPGREPLLNDPDDELVHRCVAFLKAKERGEDVSAYKDIEETLALRCGDQISRGTLEGLLLAGLTPEQAATECGLTAEVGRVYHGLFLDVGCKLDVRMWVANRLFDPVRDPDVPEGDPLTALRRAGFHIGPLAVLWLAERLRRPRLPLTLGPSVQAVQEHGGLLDELSVRVWLLVWTTPSCACWRISVLLMLKLALITLPLTTGQHAAWEALARVAEVGHGPERIHPLLDVLWPREEAGCPEMGTGGEGERVNLRGVDYGTSFTTVAGCPS